MSVAPIRTLKRNGGGAKITYYDGMTELGYANVPTGQDVLHPSITVPTKTGKTFIGWSTTTSENNWVSELTANGQPMSLYAIYLDNTKTVVSNGTITDAKYVSGNVSVGVGAPWSTRTASASFALSKGRYATATCVAYAEFDNHNTQSLDVGDATFDGDNIIASWITGGEHGSKTYTINNGSHGLFVSATAYDNYVQNGSVRVNSLVLSNPIAWT